MRTGSESKSGVDGYKVGRYGLELKIDHDLQCSRLSSFLILYGRLQEWVVEVKIEFTRASCHPLSPYMIFLEPKFGVQCGS